MSTDVQEDRSDVVFNNVAVVNEYRSKESLSTVRVTRCESARLTFHRCRIDAIFIDQVDHLELTLFECAVERFDVRRTEGLSREGMLPAGSIISIKGGTIAEFHLEQSKLIALDARQMTVTGSTFIRSLAFVDPDYAMIVNCTFEGPFYCRLHATTNSSIPTDGYVVDLRQNSFNDIAKLNLKLSGRYSRDSAVTMRGSRFSAGLRLTANLAKGTLDSSGIRVTGRSDLIVKGSGGNILLRSAHLAGKTHIRLTEVHLAAQSAEFESGGLLLIDRDLSLDGAVFGAQATVRSTANPSRVARLLGLRNAQAGELTLLGLDLRKCHFDGASGLDTLTIDGEPDIWPQWKRRRIIADEEDVRHGKCVHNEDSSIQECVEKPNAASDSIHVASCYRQLRKGREIAKDYPGSADFYYGEMEMRRWPGTRQEATSRVLLWAYWLTSGYGVKAWRALASLVIVIMLGGLALALWGLHGGSVSGPARLSNGLLTSIEFATLRNTEQRLSQAGRVVSIPLRLIAPLMFLQLIFALRSRIQR